MDAKQAEALAARLNAKRLDNEVFTIANQRGLGWHVQHWKGGVCIARRTKLMTIIEALALAAEGERVTCDALQPGCVVKLSEDDGPSRYRVVFEGDGSGYDFTPRDDHKAAEWRVVRGWA